MTARAGPFHFDPGSPSRPGIGFVFAPPDRSILTQSSEVTRFASIPNWLCLAPFAVPGPPQRERPDTPVSSARCCCLLRSHPSSPRTRHPTGLRHPPFGLRHPPSAICHSPPATHPPAPAGHALFSFRVCRVPFRASLGHPIQRGPSFYCGKKDHHQRVTTERPHPMGGSCPREGHGKAGLIRILFSVCVGEFRGWSLIPRDPRLDVAGRNRLSRPRRPGIGFVLHKEARIHP